MASAKATIDHDEIRSWVESRGGFPAHVKRTESSGNDPGVLRIDYPGYSGADSLERIDWDQWFDWFDRDNLAFLYQPEGKSRFSKLVDRKTVETGASRQPRSGRRTAAKRPSAAKRSASSRRSASPKRSSRAAASKTSSKAAGPKRSSAGRATASKRAASTPARKTSAKKPARRSASTKRAAASKSSSTRRSTTRSATRSASAARPRSTAAKKRTTPSRSTSTARADGRATRSRTSVSRSSGGRTSRSANRTTDHDEIRSWVEARGGHPARVKRSGRKNDPGILRIDYPGFSGTKSLERIGWDEWFNWFDRDKLAFLYQNVKNSRFSKLVRR